MKIGILGAGTWGVALAYLLSNNSHTVMLWSKFPSEIEALKQTRQDKRLPGLVMPSSIEYTADIKEAVSDKDIVIFVVPSKFIRATAASAVPYLSDGTVVATAAKGIEPISLKTMSEVIGEELDAGGVACDIIALSGPTHAEEVARGLPTSIVAAGENEAVCTRVAEMFSSSCVRAYTNTDIKGVELCGALKNVIAIAVGINRGMGFGDNSSAMLITRGIAEMTRIGLALGCKRRTFMGLAGIGDLVVTATSMHSRNNRCGELIGRGMKYEDAEREIGMVVEGYHALEAAIGLSQKCGVEMPITEAVYAVIRKGRSPREVMRELMARNIKSELEE